MAIKIEMLRCFATVAQNGNLAEAASRLGRTQSALSMTLKQLEETLGQRLFESDRKNRLTQLGEQVFELAQTELRQFDYTIEAIQACAKSRAGLIRIASVPSVAAQVFPVAIETLTQRHPDLRIELRDTDTQQVVDALTRGRVDLGIVSGEHTLNDVRSALLFSDSYGLICAPHHPLAQQEIPPRFEQITSVPFVRNNLLGLIESASFQEAIADAKVSVHNTMSLTAMVRTGAWVTVLPRSVVRFMSPDLVFRPLPELAERRKVSLLMRNKAAFPEFCEELWQLLLAFDWQASLEAAL
jgi:DNA-binding transcriptional LysR family regulator